MPKIDIDAAPTRFGTGYPPPYDAPCLGGARGSWATRPA